MISMYIMLAIIVLVIVIYSYRIKKLQRDHRLKVWELRKEVDYFIDEYEELNKQAEVKIHEKDILIREMDDHMNELLPYKRAVDVVKNIKHLNKVIHYEVLQEVGDGVRLIYETHEDNAVVDGFIIVWNDKLYDTGVTKVVTRVEPNAVTVHHVEAYLSPVPDSVTKIIEDMGGILE